MRACFTCLLANILDLQASVELLIAKCDMVAWVRTQTGTPNDYSIARVSPHEV
jgi:hypothetical protein